MNKLLEEYRPRERRQTENPKTGRAELTDAEVGPIENARGDCQQARFPDGHQPFSGVWLSEMQLPALSRRIA